MSARVEALITVPTGGAAVSATNSGGGPSTCTVAAGSYYLTAAGGVSSLITVFQTALNTGRPDDWTVTFSTTTGRVTIDCADEPWALSWTSTTLRDALGFTGNIASTTSAQTGTNQAKGLWFPDCPLSLDGHPSMAPKATDLLSLVGPTGNRIGLVGNVMRRHANLVWSHVPLARYRAASEALTNASWETFLNDTQHGLGNAFFTPLSKVQIYYDVAGTDTLVGADGSLSGWYFSKDAVDAPLSAAPWTGMFRIEIAEITTSG